MFSTLVKFFEYCYHILLLNGILFLVFSCHHKDDFPTVSISQMNIYDEIQIKEWQIIGPFLNDTISSSDSVSVLDRDDFFINFKIKEDSVSPTVFLSINKNSALDKLLLPENFKNTRLHIRHDHIDFCDLFGIEETTKIGGNAYAACRIESPEDKEIVFLLNNDDGVKIWLNNELLFTTYVTRGRRYENFIVAHLRKGMNFVLVKVNNSDGAWALILNMSPIKYAREIYKENSMSFFMQNNVLEMGDSLSINFDLYRSSTPTNIQVLDNKNNIVFSEQVVFEGSWDKKLDLKEGLYTCRVFFPSDTFEQHFYIGDIERALTEYQRRVEILRDINDQTRINLEALFIRYNHLLRPENRGSDIKSWGKKIVYVISELETILDNLENGREVFKNVPGTHLRGFRSRIDGQIQHYMIHVPDKCIQEKGPMPIAILVPYGVISTLPFLKNLYVANIQETERDERYARKCGCAVLWPSTRGNTNSTPIEATDIFEALEAVKLDYKVDEDRIYLSGISYGGTRALVLAARFPSLFAAVGVVQARTSGVIREHETDMPIDLVENLANIPLYFVHSNKDEMVPIEQPVKFAKKAKKFGFQPRLDILKGFTHFYYPFKAYEGPFNFFKDKVRIKNPQKILFSTFQLKYGTAYWVKINKIVPQRKAKIKATVSAENTIEVETNNVYQYEILLKNLNFNKEKVVKIKTNGRISFNGIPTNDSIVINVMDAGEKAKSSLYKNYKIEGLIMHAFADDFIVVEGTVGPESDREKLKAQVSEFRNAWKEKYFGDCKYKTDVQVDSSDIERSHLILFGNYETNTVIQKVINQMPLKIETDHIVIGDKEYRGEKLGVHLIYPNPLNRKKYVVIIGANNLDYFQLGEKHLSLKGWYDYTVWRYHDSKRPWIIDAGYFDSSWQ